MVTTALAPSMSARHVGECSSFHCAAMSSTIAVQSVDGIREEKRSGADTGALAASIFQYARSRREIVPPTPSWRLRATP